MSICNGAAGTLARRNRTPGIGGGGAGQTSHGSSVRSRRAHMAALQMDGILGRFQWARDRSARALPRLVKGQESYGIMQSFYGFGLEEAGDYARAEDVARSAAELEPFGYWPHHCVSHVLEMTGRPKDGLVWMDEREAFWSSKDNVNRVHIWWLSTLRTWSSATCRVRCRFDA
jgi:hypothetical protein